jgi:hypothetical protein
VKMTGPPSAVQTTQTPTMAATSGNKYRVRVRSQSYAKLVGGWRDVQVNTLEEWKRERDSMLQEFRQRFGTVRLSRARFGLAPGAQYARWNDATWSAIQNDLIVDGEQDVLRTTKS